MQHHHFFAFPIFFYYHSACINEGQVMKKRSVIIFNDTVVATAGAPVTYEREADDQKEYQFTDMRSGLTASLFCEDIELIENPNIYVDIF